MRSIFLFLFVCLVSTQLAADPVRLTEQPYITFCECDSSQEAYSAAAAEHFHAIVPFEGLKRDGGSVTIHVGNINTLEIRAYQFSVEYIPPWMPSPSNRQTILNTSEGRWRVTSEEVPTRPSVKEEMVGYLQNDGYIALLEELFISLVEKVEHVEVPEHVVGSALDLIGGEDSGAEINRLHLEDWMMLERVNTAGYMKRIGGIIVRSAEGYFDVDRIPTITLKFEDGTTIELEVTGYTVVDMYVALKYETIEDSGRMSDGRRIPTLPGQLVDPYLFLIDGPPSGQFDRYVSRVSQGSGFTCTVTTEWACESLGDDGVCMTTATVQCQLH